MHFIRILQKNGIDGERLIVIKGRAVICSRLSFHRMKFPSLCTKPRDSFRFLVAFLRSTRFGSLFYTGRLTRKWVRIFGQISGRPRDRISLENLGDSLLPFLIIIFIGIFFLLRLAFLPLFRGTGTSTIKYRLRRFTHLFVYV